MILTGLTPVVLATGERLTDGSRTKVGSMAFHNTSESEVVRVRFYIVPAIREGQPIPAAVDITGSKLTDHPVKALDTWYWSEGDQLTISEDESLLLSLSEELGSVNYFLM